MDYKKLDNIEIDGIDYIDSPDFVDAYISYAELDGIALTDSQLDELNSDSDYVYQCVINKVY